MKRAKLLFFAIALGIVGVVFYNYVNRVDRLIPESDPPSRSTELDDPQETFEFPFRGGACEGMTVTEAQMRECVLKDLEVQLENAFTPYLLIDVEDIDELINLSEILPALEDGYFVYNQFSELKLGESETLVLKVAPTKTSAPDLSAVLAGEQKRGVIKITPELSAELQGTAGLDVEAMSTKQQRISDATPVEWSWKITPNRASEAELLTISIYLHVDENSPIRLKSYEEQITVTISPWLQMKSLVAEISPVWGFFAAVIPLSCGAVIWIRKRKWREPKSQWRPIVGAGRPADRYMKKKRKG